MTKFSTTSVQLLSFSSSILLAGLYVGSPSNNAYAQAPTIESSQALQQLRSQPEETPKNDVILFDFIEDGEIVDGAMIPADLTNPMQAAVHNPLAPPPPPYTAETVIDNGDPENRIDIVIVGDGYTESELTQYENHTSAIVDDFFAEGVLNAYQHYFNVHRVDVISNESGVDNDPEGTEKDTALDMTYHCGGIARSLCVNVSKARAAASNAPDYDQILALANSSTYGGAGYPGSDLGTLAGNNNSALEIAIHEFGHSFADLADEYTYGGPETYEGAERHEVNVSIYQKEDMENLTTKWYRWFDEPGVDTFEGGHYSVHGIYRPTENSKMRNLGRPFGPINNEAMVIKVYQSVSPIDSGTPEGQVLYGSTLNVQPTQPVGHSLDIEWWIDGELSTHTGTTFDTSQLTAEEHTVAVRVIDHTELVRDEEARSQWLTAERVWNIVDEITTEETDVSITLSANSFQGWATPFFFWLSQDTGSINYTMTVNNFGPNIAENVTVQSQLSESIVNATINTQGVNCFLERNFLFCSLGDMEPNSSVSVNVVATTASRNDLPFQASVDSDTDDTNAENNSDNKSFGGSFGVLLLCFIVC